MAEAANSGDDHWLSGILDVPLDYWEFGNVGGNVADEVEALEPNREPNESGEALEPNREPNESGEASSHDEENEKLPIGGGNDVELNCSPDHHETIQAAVGGVVDVALQPLMDLCSSKQPLLDILIQTGEQVKLEVRIQAYEEMEKLNSTYGEGGATGKRLINYFAKKLITKSVDSALERSGIPSFLVNETLKDLELIRLRERNRVLEMLCAQPHGKKRPKMRSLSEIERNMEPGD